MNEPGDREFDTAGSESLDRGPVDPDPDPDLVIQDPVSEPMIVPPALDGERVDRALALLTGYTRAEVQGLILGGAVTVGAVPVAKSYRIATGEVLELLAEPPTLQMPVAEDVPIVVVAADDEFIIVDKPAGLVVHPGAGNTSGTMVNGLLAVFPELAGVGAPERPGIVHRLDRDTSGLLVVARTSAAYDALVAQLSSRSMERCYDVLAWGSFDSSRGVIDAPVGRSPARRTRMAVRADGRATRTGFEVTRSFTDPGVTRLECRLETGRTHQIRVHLAAIGHPVVGDATYGGFRQSLPLDRPFLHAATLGFVHPTTGESVHYRSALPTELAAVLEELGALEDLR